VTVEQLRPSACLIRNRPCAKHFRECHHFCQGPQFRHRLLAQSGDGERNLRQAFLSAREPSRTALALGRLVESQLLGIRANDPLVMALAVAVITVVSALAGYLPAERATRIDPMNALRYE
jgi:hypothetical protein